MQRRRKPLRRPLPPLKLYLDDLEEVAEIISGAGTGTLVVETDDYAFDSVDDLKNLREKRIRSLDIRSDDPNIHVHFGPSSSEIHGPADVPELMGVASHIEDALKKRRKRVYMPARKSTPEGIGSQGEIINYTTIIPKRRSDSPSFWARNQDRVILLVFGWALGVTSTIIASQLL